MWSWPGSSTSTEWWFALLQNGGKFVSLPWDASAPAQLLYSTVQQLQVGDAEAQRMGQRALELFREGLHPRVVELCWRHLLTGAVHPSDGVHAALQCCHSKTCTCDPTPGVPSRQCLLLCPSASA